MLRVITSENGGPKTAASKSKNGELGLRLRLTTATDYDESSKACAEQSECGGLGYFDLLDQGDRVQTVYSG